MTRLLAIDPGLSTGWSIWEDGELLGSGSFDVRKLATGKPPAREEALYDRLMVLSRQWGPPTLVVYELPVMRGKASASMNNQIGVIKLHAQKLTAPPFPVNPSELKKWATGRGNASKADMIQAARKWDPAVTQHDEADAILVGAWAWDSVEIR